MNEIWDWLPTPEQPWPAAARLYAAHELPVIPCHVPLNGSGCSCDDGPRCKAAGKHPRFSGWQKLGVPTADHLRGWENWADCNLGIVMGGSARLVALDIDGPAGRASLASLEAEHGPLPQTLSSRSGRPDGGEHRVFRAPEDLDLLLIRNRAGVAALGQPGLDIRTSGGQIIVCPSLHRAGTRYEWVDRIAPAPLPRWLFDLAVSAGRKKKVAMPVSQVRHPSTASDAVTRARAYLAKMPASISGQGGHDAAFRAALVLVRGFALAEGQALDILLTDFNPRCEPPWTERELQHKVESASSDGSLSMGYLLDTPRPGWTEQAAAAPSAEPPSDMPEPPDEAYEDDAEHGAGSGSLDRGSVAKILVGLATVNSYLFRDQHGTPHAMFPKENGRIAPVKAGVFRRWLAGLYYKSRQKAPSADQIGSALNVIGYLADEGPRHDLEVRFTVDDGKVWIDLADDSGRAYCADENGWNLTQPGRPMFRRHPHMLPLPEAVRGGSIQELRPFLNLAGDTDWILLRGWLPTIPLVDIPRAGLSLAGPAGSGKTSLACLLRSCWDPSSAQALRIRNEETELAQLLWKHAVAPFDNLTHVSQSVSDLLCQAITGGAFSKRELFSDSDDVIFAFRRAVILTGISHSAEAEDLLDRLMLVNLKKIPPSKKREERQLWGDFRKAHPRILGGLLDALVGAMREYPRQAGTAVARMADFCRWACSADAFLGRDAHPVRDEDPKELPKFLDVYLANTKEKAEEVAEADVVARAVRAFMEERQDWQGSPTDLYGALAKLVPDRDKPGSGFPKKSDGLTKRLRRLENSLFELGLKLTSWREPGGTRPRVIRIERIPDRHDEDEEEVV
ncbi:MAG: bifunctional DNA primase/polymerase [Acidobacteria bacterium]|nr:bifunctional DNA primase/polymerase [Acidobacteriota bacterium]